MELSVTSGRGSYTAAYEALEEALAEYPDVRYVVDIHRDILLDDNGNMLRPVTAGEAGTMAQMRLVIGTDADGAPYEDWETGAAASLALAEKLAASYPSLLMPTGDLTLPLESAFACYGIDSGDWNLRQQRRGGDPYGTGLRRSFRGGCYRK